MKLQIRKEKNDFVSLKVAAGYTLLGVWSVICLLPLYWMTIASFKDAGTIDKPPAYVPFLDFIPSLDAWRFILFEANENLMSRAFNSIVIGVCSTFLTLLLGCMAVYGITRFKQRLNSFAWVAIILSTRVLPPVAIALPLYAMAQSTGTLDRLDTLVFIYTAINLPIAVWLLVPIFGPRATDQEEAAQLEGVSHFYVFFRILLPTMRAAMMVVGVIVFLQCWNEYLFAAYLTSDNALTLPPWMVGQLSMKEAQTGGGPEEVAHLAAATVFMALPVVLLTIFAQRSFTKILRQNAANRNY